MLMTKRGNLILLGFHGPLLWSSWPAGHKTSGLSCMKVLSAVSPQNKRICLLCSQSSQGIQNLARSTPNPPGSAINRLQNGRQGIFGKQTRLWLSFLKQVIQGGDVCIDATCGNGNDTVSLARLVGPNGSVYAMDIQEQAVESTRLRLKNEYAQDPEQMPTIHYYVQCHSTFPTSVPDESVSAIVYNLGWLPDVDLTKADTEQYKYRQTVRAQTLSSSFSDATDRVITLPHTTLMSLRSACKKLCVGGLISISCYVMHNGGMDERLAVLGFCRNELSPRFFTVVSMDWENRQGAPSLIIIEKIRSWKN